MFVRCKSLSPSLRASRAQIIPACVRQFRGKTWPPPVVGSGVGTDWSSAPESLKNLDFIGDSAYAQRRKNTPRGIDGINVRTKTIN
jgi:hypothetical protein